MVDTVRILIVEDDERAVGAWNKTIEIHNADLESNRFLLVPTVVGTADAAFERLAERYFDAAVIDLRLGGAGAGGHNAQGNLVVKRLASTEPAATAIYTGQPGEAEIPEIASHIRIFVKGDGLDPVYKWLVEQSAIILQIQQVQRVIRRDMASIFHSSIWPRWQMWMQSGAGETLQAAVTRHFVSHLQATLLNSTSGKAHSEEWYFVPPMKESRLVTGDMFKGNDDVVEILVTPRCDLARDENIKTYQLAYCEDVSEEWAALERRAREGSRAAQQDVAAWVQHRRKNSIHFLPRMVMNDGQSRGPWFVRFDKIRTQDHDAAATQELKVRRFAALTSEFLPTLVERLGGYFSRIGSPDLS